METLETRLFKTLKKYPKSELIKDLIEQGVDCNLSHFDGHTRTFIFSMELAAKNDRHTSLHILYEHRNSMTKIQLEQHLIFYINHYDQLQKEKNEIVFDYTISRLLYHRISSEYSKNDFDTLITALHDYDNAKYRGQSLSEGSTSDILLQLRIYTLFQQIINMKINFDDHLFTIIENELLHNLETYYFLKSIDCIPIDINHRIMNQTFSEIQSLQGLIRYYRSIAKNLITKIEELKINEEYTIPTGWIEHAVCVSFQRINSTYIIIRVDNPSPDNPKKMHNTEPFMFGYNRVTPRILGKLNVDNLEVNLDYFIMLIDSIKRDLTSEEGRSLIYNLNGQIRLLEEIQIETIPSFIEQATMNCFVKCYEPGFRMRLGRKYHELCEKLLLCEKNNADKLVKLIEEEHQGYLTQLFCEFTTLAKENMSSLPVSEKVRLQDKLKMSYTKQYKHLLSHVNSQTCSHLNDKYVSLRFEKNNVSIELKNIFKNESRILLLGEAGCGKTTICQYITYSWAIGKIWRNEFDWLFYIRMRNLNSQFYSGHNNTYSLIDIIERECFRDYYQLLNSDKQKLINLLKTSSNILWILDGCDERTIPKYLASIEKQLFNQSHLLLTSRPYVTHNFLYDIQIQIQSFTDEDIEKYIGQYFSFTLRTTGKECWSFIRCADHLLQIARIPACLEIICNLWEKDKGKFDFGMTREQIYEKMCDYLLQQYLLKYHHLCKSALAGRDIYRECKATPFTHLEHLAFEAVKSNQLVIRRQENTKVSKALFLSALRIGLLIPEKRNFSSEVIEDSYYFIHRSFQEYLAARYIVKTLESINKQMNDVIQFISHEKYSRRTRDVFRFFFDAERSSSCTNQFWEAVDNDPRDLVGLRHCSRIAYWFPRGSCMFTHTDRENIDKRTTDAILEWISDRNRQAHDYGNRYLFEWFADATGDHCWRTAWREDLFIEDASNRRYFLSTLWSTENIDTLRKIYDKIPRNATKLYRLITTGPTVNNLTCLQLDPTLFTLCTPNDQNEISSLSRTVQEQIRKRKPITTLTEFQTFLQNYSSFASFNRQSMVLDNETWRLEIISSALEDINNETLALLLELSQSDKLFFRYFKFPTSSFVELYAKENHLNDDILRSLVVLITMSSDCLLTALCIPQQLIRIQENETFTDIPMDKSRWSTLTAAFARACNTYGYSSFFQTI